MTTERWWGVGFNADHLPSESGHYVYTPVPSADAARALKAELMGRDKVWDELVHEWRSLNAKLRLVLPADE